MLEAKTTVIDPTPGLTEKRIRDQMNLIFQDPRFRSSKRSIEFLQYVVEQTLNGSVDQIKERTIGEAVFGRKLSYDTNVDHIVRTAATDLRRRLALYYGAEEHSSQLQISLIPGSYIPRFVLGTASAKPGEASFDEDPIVNGNQDDLSAPIEAGELGPRQLPDVRRIANAQTQGKKRIINIFVLCTLPVILGLTGYWGYISMRSATAQEAFWKPILDARSPVPLILGESKGLPTTPPENQEPYLPVLPISRNGSIPFGDTVTATRVATFMGGHGKDILVRREDSSSLSDLNQGPIILVGAFTNDWNLLLTRQLRFTFAIDAVKQLIYIKDAKNPSARGWCWSTSKPLDHKRGPGSPILTDYALISRTWNAETGHVILSVGGLYTYGTEAAGVFLTDPNTMRGLGNPSDLKDIHKSVQIVLKTTVTDETPGAPQVVAFIQE